MELPANLKVLLPQPEGNRKANRAVAVAGAVVGTCPAKARRFTWSGVEFHAGQRTFRVLGMSLGSSHTSKPQGVWKPRDD